jgi:hypothetical protein
MTQSQQDMLVEIRGSIMRERARLVGLGLHDQSLKEVLQGKHLIDECDEKLRALIQARD